MLASWWQMCGRWVGDGPLARGRRRCTRGGRQLIAQGPTFHLEWATDAQCANADSKPPLACIDALRSEDLKRHSPLVRHARHASGLSSLLRSFRNSFLFSSSPFHVYQRATQTHGSYHRGKCRGPSTAAHAHGGPSGRSPDVFFAPRPSPDLSRLTDKLLSHGII
jgi:hypothetical protein